MKLLTGNSNLPLAKAIAEYLEIPLTDVSVRRFADEEVTIIGLQERLHNENEATVSELGLTKRSHVREGLVAAGVLGAWVVRDDAGREYTVGSGIDEMTAIRAWREPDQYIGRRITIRYFPSSYATPRHPRFICFREDV